MSLDDEVRDIQSEDNSHDNAPESSENEPTESERQEGSEIQADLSHISSSKVNVAGNNVINIQVSSSEQAREILREVKEEFAARRVSPPPSPDAPLQELVDHWFDNELATDRQKFFAISLSMFDGLKYPDFRDIYEIVIHVMEVDKEEEKEKKPRSRFGTADDELVEIVKAKISRNESGLEEVIELENDRYPAAIFDLMRRRYRSVLLDLLPALKQVVEKHRYWEIRFGASLAVAEIGKLGFHRMRSEVLQPWASDKRAYVRASVGYPLARLAEDENFRRGVENVLDDWTDPNWQGPGETWRYRWTAASTFKHIGLIEEKWAKDWTYRGLKNIAGFDDIRLADSVIHSLTVLSLQGQLAEVLHTLKEWIEQGSAGSEDEQAPMLRCVVGILAFMVLSEVHIELATEEEEEIEEIGIQVKNLFELVCQSEAEQGEIWQLVVAVGVRAFEYRLANAFFHLIARWTDYATENPAIQNTVRNLLAEVFVQVPSKRREHILNRLNRWQKQTKDEYLAEMASSAKEKIKQRVLAEPLPTSPESNRVVFGD